MAGIAFSACGTPMGAAARRIGTAPRSGWRWASLLGSGAGTGRLDAMTFGCRRVGAGCARGVGRRLRGLRLGAARRFGVRFARFARFVVERVALRAQSFRLRPVTPHVQVPTAHAPTAVPSASPQARRLPSRGSEYPSFGQSPPSRR